MDIGLQKWLDSKNKYSDKTKHYQSKYCKEAYYESKNDIDVNKDDLFLKDILSGLNSNSLDEKDIPNDILDELEYKDHIILNHKKNHYHANTLFRKLIDYTIDHDITCSSYDTDAYIFDLYMKKSFYKFCQKYS